jgi:hypothetical protein
LTAAKIPDKPGVGHNELSAMATGAILCWLTHDTYAGMRITEEIEGLGFTPEQVATTFGGDGREDAGGGGGHENKCNHRC